MILRTYSRLLVTLGALSALSCGAVYAQSPYTYLDFHDFGGKVKNATGTLGPDGISSWSTVTFDTAGNMYGTAAYGGPLPSKYNYSGMVWELTKSGIYIDLHDFGGTVTNANGSQGPDGQVPMSGVTFDSSGNMYGSTLFGGPNGNGGAGYSGMVWEITKGGKYIDLHDFGSGSDGGNPCGNVTVDANGNIYGTASAGGPNDGGIDGAGMVWEISKSGAYSDLHDFGGNVSNASGSQGPDGYMPYAGVTLDSNGNIFGTASRSGPFGGGCIWEITKSGDYIDLHDFASTVTNASGVQGPDGSLPYSTVTIDASGNRYGTTVVGGANGTGMIWELAADGTYSDLHDFGGSISNANGTKGPDGMNPYSGLVVDSFGSLYGTTSYGGPNSWQGESAGIAWTLSSKGVYSDLHDFGGKITNVLGSLTQDGVTPWAGVSLDSSGNLYGTTSYGDTATGNGPGMVWSLQQLSIGSVSVSPLSVQGGTSATGTVTLTSAAPWTGLLVPVSSSSPSVSLPSSVIVAPGALTGTFTVKTYGVNSATSPTIIAGSGLGQRTTTFTITPAALTALTLSPTSIGGGGTAIGTVTLSGPAGVGGTSIVLASSNSNVTVPQTVLVPSGQMIGTFTVTTQAVATAITSNITASLGSVIKTAQLSVTPAQLALVSISPSSVTGGAISTATVSLNGSAFKGGYPVTLVNTSVFVTIPKTVTVPEGASSVTFPVATKAVPTQQSVTITAKNGTIVKTAVIAILPPALSSLTLSPTTVSPGGSSTATVKLNGPAPSSGFTITLASSSSKVTLPSTVKVAAGQTSATFTIKTTKSTPAGSVTVTATAGTIKETATLTVS